MEKLLISACLAGENTRYDGKNNEMPELIEELGKYFELVLFCPEVVGGLPTPRDPSEIRGNTVYQSSGRNVTDAFVRGAHEAYRLCSYFGIRYAVMKDGSPSCGSTEIHDGTFSGRKIKGKGFTAQYLEDHGVHVYNEANVSELLEEMAKREQRYAERDRIRAARLEQETQGEAEEPRREHEERRPRREHDDRRSRQEGERRPYKKREGDDRKPRKFGDHKGRKPRFGDKKGKPRFGDHKGGKRPYHKAKKD